MYTYIYTYMYIYIYMYVYIFIFFDIHIYLYMIICFYYIYKYNIFPVNSIIISNWNKFNRDIMASEHIHRDLVHVDVCTYMHVYTMKISHKSGDKYVY